jgi:hypothetical protein
MHAERPTRPTRLALLIAAFVVAALLWPTASSATIAIGATSRGSGAHGAGPSDEIAHLSLTGAFTAGNHLRGRALVIHRGETVQFRVAQSDGDGSHHGTDRHSQITLDSAALPGGGHSIHLNSNSAYRVTFTKPGVYSFHWQAAKTDQSRALPTTLTDLVQAALNSVQRWTGQVIVDTGLVTGQAAQEARADSAASGRKHQSGTVAVAGTGSVAGAASAGTGSVAGTASAGTGSVAGTATRPAGPPASGGTSPRIHGPGPLANPPPPAARAPRAVHRAAPAVMPQVATYVFSGLFGFLILGILWMVWVASIRPILGR